MGPSAGDRRASAALQACTPVLCQMSVSPDLIWPIVRDPSCFVVKRRQSGRSRMGKAGARMTTEANNLTGINSFKYSGLANAKTVDLMPVSGGGVELVTKIRKNANVPAKQLHKVKLTRDFRRIAKTIVKETTESYYRPDLNKAALAKWSLIYKSQKRAKTE